MSDYGFEGLDFVWKWTFGLFAILLPLGIWKIVDIVIWIFKHIDISWN